MPELATAYIKYSDDQPRDEGGRWTSGGGGGGGDGGGALSDSFGDFENVSSERRKELKKEITEKLHTSDLDKVLDDSNSLYDGEAVARAPLSVWSAYEDDNPAGYALQRAVAEKYDIEINERMQGKISESREKIERAMPAMGGQEGLDIVVGNIYNNTQERLSSLGYKPDDEITLYRGLRFKESLGVGVGDRFPIRSNPISSYSISKTVADSFAKTRGTSHGYTISTKVKAKDIFSLPNTGIGSYSEGEIIVFGRAGNSEVLSTW